MVERGAEVVREQRGRACERRISPVLRVSGSDVVPASGAEAFGASTVFLAHAALAENPALSDRVAAALKGGRGIAWVTGGGRVVGLPLDDGGRTTHDLAPPTGRTIAAGSHVDTADPRAATIDMNPDIVIVSELSLRELFARGVDALTVLEGYADLDLECCVLDARGPSAALSGEEVLLLAQRVGVDELTLVLRRA
jgi:hypothetical protein